MNSKKSAWKFFNSVKKLFYFFWFIKILETYIFARDRYFFALEDQQNRWLLKWKFLWDRFFTTGRWHIVTRIFLQSFFCISAGFWKLCIFKKVLFFIGLKEFHLKVHSKSFNWWTVWFLLLFSIWHEKIIIIIIIEGGSKSWFLAAICFLLVKILIYKCAFLWVGHKKILFVRLELRQFEIGKKTDAKLNYNCNPFFPRFNFMKSKKVKLFFHVIKLL